VNGAVAHLEEFNTLADEARAAERHRSDQRGL
jgi:hypothetical protein